ncbi:uncharacterized protein EV422DRAFT_619160 [Fimicolochytrium jonesii]|uniref:uncharacterized protein n=1 Tax=Fimicolochytrium jonesii TaxID=1396493 RepID=UPI0022FECC6E|nr:uncharacterized protein EV422DRAFT_619160 [Fimicolochytrium jonesii]KAI8821986.1 hypothetical protein EV422DRAFT_619160 [Fimicolochytrium jonesii]
MMATVEPDVVGGQQRVLESDRPVPVKKPLEAQHEDGILEREAYGAQVAAPGSVADAVNHSAVKYDEAIPENDGSAQKPADSGDDLPPLSTHTPVFPDSNDDVSISTIVTPLPNAPRCPVTVAFGPRNGWYVRWSDGTSGWESLPPSLHAKLNKRLPSLPGVRQLSISDNSEWFVSFDDGSIATSGFPPRGKLWDALHSDADADITNLVFAPGGGFLLTREDGTYVFERLPTTLNDLLNKRGRGDPRIDYVAISKLGGWFVMFEDRECIWEGLPPRLEKVLIQTVRKNPPLLLVGLSSSEMMHYFVAVGTATDTNIDYPGLKAALSWAKRETDVQPEMNVNYTGPMPVPPVDSAIYEDLFRHAAAGDFSDGLSPDAGDAFDLDDDVKSSIGGGGSVVEVKLGGAANKGSGYIYGAPIDGNVEAEEGGRLLLRAASSAQLETKDPKRGWSLMGASLPSPTIQPPAAAILPSASTAAGSPSSSAGIGSFFSSVFGLSKTPDQNAQSTRTTSRNRSRTRQDSRGAKQSQQQQQGGQQQKAMESPQDVDEYDSASDMMLDRVAQLKGQLQERLSELPTSSRFYPPLTRLSKKLDEHAYHLTTLRSQHTTPEQLADTEYYVLYCEGWLEASEIVPLDNPWLNGWVEGKFGCSVDEVAKAVQAYNKTEEAAITGAHAVVKGSGVFSEEPEDILASDTDAVDVENGKQVDADVTTSAGKTEQQTIDEHLRLSYVYEAEFTKTVGLGLAPSASLTDTAGQNE